MSGQTHWQENSKTGKTEFNNYPNPLEKRNITSVPSQSSSSAVRVRECWSWPLKKTAQETSERRRYWYHVLKGKSSSRPPNWSFILWCVYSYSSWKVYGCFQKIGVPPKMDGENSGKTLLKWDDFGGKKPPFFRKTPIWQPPQPEGGLCR